MKSRLKLKQATIETIKKIAAASGLTPEEVIRKIERPNSSKWVNTHLNYGN